MSTSSEKLMEKKYSEGLTSVSGFVTLVADAIEDNESLVQTIIIDVISTTGKSAIKQVLLVIAEDNQ